MTTETEISSRVLEIFSRGTNIPSELSVALAHVTTDPATSLAKSRICLEALVKSMLARYGIPTPKGPVGPLIDKEPIKKGCPLIHAKMQYVNGIASAMGTHSDIPPDSKYALRVLEELCDIFDWYCLDVKDNFGNQLQENEKVIVYVSGGGTCRCAMANVITRYYLTEWNKLTYVRPMSCAFNKPTEPKLSEGALTVLTSHFGTLSGSHQSIKLDDRYVLRADIILAMDSKLVTNIRGMWPALSEKKVILFSEFFGGEGNVDDPYTRPPSIQKYEKCFEHLDGLISQGRNVLDKLAVK
jgi:protein-tyrosine-phosphatase